MMDHQMRHKLGDYSSIVCIKAIVTGLEEIMGVPAARGNLVLAGKKRGKKIARSLRLTNSDLPFDQLRNLLSKALGEDGTKLCEINKIENVGDKYNVYLSETICSSGEEEGSSRQLTFTMGAIHGAMEEITGHRLSSKQTGSVLRGSDFDIVELAIRK